MGITAMAVYGLEALVEAALIAGVLMGLVAAGFGASLVHREGAASISIRGWFFIIAAPFVLGGVTSLGVLLGGLAFPEAALWLLG